MVKEQCLLDVAIKMNSSVDCTNVLVANLKPASFAMLMRPKKAETAVHGCYQSGSLIFMVV